MPLETDDSGQPLAPTGIHWQVSQATTLQNLKFTMPRGDNATHVGIFTENGSGGFVSGKSPCTSVFLTNTANMASDLV